MKWVGLLNCFQLNIIVYKRQIRNAFPFDFSVLYRSGMKQVPVRFKNYQNNAKNEQKLVCF